VKKVYSGKRITIIGLARSGLSAALVLKAQGAVVFGSDRAIPSNETQKAFETVGLPIEVGGHTDRVFDADLMVLSPGVPVTSAVVVKAKSRGIPVLSEIEIAYHLTDADIVGITGSNGKSTTTALLGELFKKLPVRSAVGGNIGDALTGKVEGLHHGDVLVAEISSFQLDSIEQFRPRAALILNLTPDHLDRYESADHYYESKLSITRNQTSDDLLVLNAEDAETVQKVKTLRSHAAIHWFSLEKEVENGSFVREERIVHRMNGLERDICGIGEVGLIGIHNLANILAAVSIVGWYGLSAPAIREVLMNFKGIEHRIEHARTVNGVRYYNDSKGTNVDSVRFALLGFPRGIHLIAGGRDKASDFSLLNELIRERVVGVYAIGEAAEKMKTVWTHLTRVIVSGNMEQALQDIQKVVQPGEVVLLSPACASFDQYRNYEERGRHFKQLVEKL